MPIEFNCTQCSSLLRVPDDTAGKQAKCPQCGTVVEIPGQSTPIAAPPLAAVAPPPRSPESPEDANNPYRSPAMGDAPPFPPGYSPSPFAAARTGPPWERDGKSFKSFVETAKLLMTALTFFFTDMRREGGLGAPLLFGMIGGMIGATFNLLVQFGFQAAMMFVPGNADPEFGPAQGLIMFAIFAAVAILIIPLAMVAGMFFNAGLTHLMLILLGGARFPFETTFRVVAYCQGGTSLLLLIPCCGQYVQGLVQLVFVIFGIWKAHEISGGKAAAAVLLPIGLCMLVAGGVVAAILATAVIANQ